jgi:hypothetical protein
VLGDDTMPMQIVSQIGNSGFALVLGRYGDDRNALRFVQQYDGLSDDPCPLKAADLGNDDMVKEIVRQLLAHDQGWTPGQEDSGVKGSSLERSSMRWIIDDNEVVYASRKRHDRLNFPALLAPGCEGGVKPIV